MDQGTSYSPRDMELTEGVQDRPLSETPRGRLRLSTVRRNLADTFDEAAADPDETFPLEIGGGQPLHASTPRIVDTAEGSNTKSQWRNLFLFWIFMFVLGGACVLAIYRYFPGYMLLCLTKEFLVAGSLAMMCVILLSVIMKLVSADSTKPVAADNRTQPSPQTVQRKRPMVQTPRPASTDRSSPRSEMMTFAEGHGAPQIQIKRTFKGDGNDIWIEFIRYFENVAHLNDWTTDRKRRVLFTTFRGQAETYAYGLSDAERGDYEQLKQAMDNRFGHKAMKESYITEAKLRKKKDSESFRDFAQSVEDLYRRAHPDNRDFVQESSLKTFLDNCCDTEDFRLAVRRTRPKTLQDAVTAAMQEECIRVSEDRKHADGKPYKPRVYQVNQPQVMKDKEPMPIQRNVHAQGDIERPKKACYRCHSTEHLIKNCPKRVKNRNDGTGSKNGSADPLNGERPGQ